MIALDSFLDHGAVLDVVRTAAFSAGKCSWRVFRRVVLRVCALNTMYAWMSILKLATRFRRRAPLLHIVMRFRCVTAGNIVDERFVEISFVSYHLSASVLQCASCHLRSF